MPTQRVEVVINVEQDPSGYSRRVPARQLGSAAIGAEPRHIGMVLGESAT
jgi:hypothetical protein